ncbi:MAG: ABC transporter ATP-binding protein/permease [Spirochaetales bacterium]|nr:ABC transporter ATP-binding protein/permease [Spirochaetales bacterium]
MVLEVLMEVLIPAIMAQIIDVGVAEMDMNYILLMSAFLILTALLSLFFGVMGAKFGSDAGAGFSTNLRHDLYSKVQEFSFSDIDRFSPSSLITRLTTDVQRVQQLFTMSIRMFVRSPMMLIFSSIMAFRAGGVLAMIFIIVLPILALAIAIMVKITYSYFNAAFKGYDRFNQVVGENLSGIRTVKAYVREDKEKVKFGESAENIRYNFTKAQKMMAAMSPLMMFVSYGCMIAISYFGAKLVNVGSMDTGSLMSIFTYTGQILSSLMMTGMIVVMYTMTKPSMERVAEVLSSKSSMDENEDGEKVVPDGSISFENVDFGYKEGSKVLKNINLEIKSGEMVGVIGTTGSGKTTLVSLIARLYDTTNGRVKVGGRDVREYNLDALRDSVSVVLQKNTLFSGSVRENLQWGKEDATEEEMKRALDISSALSFVMEKEGGLDYHVEQGGSNFSGGQRQRLCIARALLKSPKILIMDDSTSAVDTKTDRKIRESLRRDVNSMTRIIISQRVSSIEDADKIVIMNAGRIEDVGTHSQLMERNAGYRNLYETQTKGRE